MARLIFGMNQSLDGYVNHEAFAPGDVLFRHFIDQVRTTTASIYGTGMYEVMKVWHEDQPEWDTALCEFGAAWRAQPKYVVSRSLTSVGPNCTLVGADFEAVIRRLKAELEGEIRVDGPVLAYSLAKLGLIDEYQIYLRPVVLGGGAPFFRGPLPPLRLVAHEEISEDALRLTYVPA